MGKVTEITLPGVVVWDDGFGCKWQTKQAAEEANAQKNRFFDSAGENAPPQIETPKKAEIIARHVQIIRSLAEEGDSERTHVLADNALLAALRELGAGEIAEAWEHVKETVGFWYS